MSRLFILKPFVVASMLFVVDLELQADTLTFAPTADAAVSEGSAGTNYGDATELTVRHSDANVTWKAYLTFVVSGVAGTPASVTLRLYSQTQDGQVDAYAIGDTSWAESTLTWNNAPTMGSGIAGANAAPGNWLDIDVSAHVTGNGTYSIGLQTSVDAVGQLNSREGTNPPQLVVFSAPTATSPPVIGAIDRYLVKDSAWGPLDGVNAIDAFDGPVDLVVASDNVDASTPGTYTVRYTAQDTDGNAASKEITVTVVADASALPEDTEPPVIFAVDHTVQQYACLGPVPAMDANDGPLTATVLEYNLDTTTVGNGTVTYSATDSSGNGSTKQITVTVVANSAYAVISPAQRRELYVVLSQLYNEHIAPETFREFPVPPHEGNAEEWLNIGYSAETAGNFVVFNFDATIHQDYYKPEYEYLRVEVYLARLINLIEAFQSYSHLYENVDQVRFSFRINLRPVEYCNYTYGKVAPGMAESISYLDGIIIDSDVYKNQANIKQFLVDQFDEWKKEDIVKEIGQAKLTYWVRKYVGPGIEIHYSHNKDYFFEFILDYAWQPDYLNITREELESYFYLYDLDLDLMKQSLVTMPTPEGGE